MACYFSRQLNFAQALVDSYARLTAEALLTNRIDYAKELAQSFALVKMFRESRIWYDWKCSTYEIFVKKFSECCKNGF